MKVEKNWPFLSEELFVVVVVVLEAKVDLEIGFWVVVEVWVVVANVWNSTSYRIASLSQT